MRMWYYCRMLKFLMLSRYKKIEGDSRFSAAEIEDNTIKLTSIIFFYLLLTPSIYGASGACETLEIYLCFADSLMKR